MTEHTRLPWSVRDHITATNGRHIWVEGGPPIGETRAGPYRRQILEDEDYDEKAADAAFIVKAVNNHDALLEALTDLMEAVRRDSDEGGKGISGYTAARLSDARGILSRVEGKRP